MSPELRLQIAADFPALAAAQAAVRDFLEASDVPRRCIEAIDVVLEELGGNVVRHARPRDGVMRLGLEVRSDRVLVTLEDGGESFDPASAPADAPAASLAEARTDGRGLILVRHLTQSLAYERIDGRNRVTASFSAEEEGRSPRGAARGQTEAVPYFFEAVGALVGEAGDTMSISYDDIGQRLRRIVISGRLDQPGTDAIAAQLAELVAVPERNVVVDLSNLRFLASIGLGALVASAKAVQQRGGRMVLVASGASTVMMSLEATGVDQLIPVYGSLFEAESALAP